MISNDEFCRQNWEIRRWNGFSSDHRRGQWRVWGQCEEWRWRAETRGRAGRQMTLSMWDGDPHTRLMRDRLGQDLSLAACLQICRSWPSNNCELLTQIGNILQLILSSTLQFTIVQAARTLLITHRLSIDHVPLFPPIKTQLINKWNEKEVLVFVRSIFYLFLIRNYTFPILYMKSFEWNFVWQR